LYGTAPKPATCASPFSSSAVRVAESGMKLDHLGIVDPRIAPSETFEKVWAHYGMTADALTERLLS